MPNLENFVTFDFDKLNAYDNECIGVYCLSDRERTIILSALRVVVWPTRWTDQNGKLLRDVGREIDLDLAIERSHQLLAKLTEC